ncbi:alkaline phosphatase D family protein [Bailinhaonella thermotolerans]|uniref:Twin-arginine translocation signal domain-containing protein n=1 Tax=Bailinhaonella thermotolerans TaxID=1070861 RepID=A0A3A4AFK5_9ACTN|nr:alkaline phosphatase D family protein [Bailinhaonella thermotolerans]RJL24790.1 twin-arginine translocation signal domain-containing protein [Bailinhaonella thermotolerans]
MVDPRLPGEPAERAARAPVGRRGFLKAAAVGTGALGLPVALPVVTPAPASAPARASVAPFQHGVASGDPLPDGVLLWTRVTPSPEAVPGSGAGPVVEVGWQVALDPGFREIAAAGSQRTGPDRDHTVKADVRGLSPGTEYHYRFLYGDAASPPGRTRTAPAAGTSVDALRFGVVSCSNWEAGHFAAYRRLAERGDLDAVVHLGDYIYEYGTGDFDAGGRTVRRNVPAHEILTLADYRVRHATYKSDPYLRGLHAQAPWIIVWDDHEAANDAWSGGAQNHTPETEGPWAARLAASRQAYFEWMPVRVGADGAIHRRLRFGDLAEFFMLDLRSYRSQQVRGTAVDDPARTITGRAQMAWLRESLSASDARWRLIGNSVMVAPLALGALPAHLLGPMRRLLGIPEGGIAVNTDQWDGYAADRKRLLTHLRDEGIENTVFLTGDIHTSWASDVPLTPLGPTVASEFVVPSVTSDNIDDFLRVPPRTASLTAEGVIRATNRHVKMVELDSHGYGVLRVTPARATMDWYRLSDRTSEDATATRFATYETRSGDPGVRRVWLPT